MQTQKVITCPNPACGAEIPADVDKCPVCGTDLYEVMITRATEEMKKNPKDTTSYLTRAYAYGEKGDNTRAIADLDYAIRLDPNLKDAYVLRGSKRIDMGDHQAAIADLNYAIKLAPNDAEAHFYRGVAYSAMKEPKSAMADFDQSIKLDPNHINTYIQRAMLFDDQGNTGRAIAELETAIQKATDPYERTQIEDLLAKLRQFQSDKTKERMRSWLRGWRLQLLIGLILLAIGFIGNNPGFMLFGILVIGGWPAIKFFIRAIFR